MKVRNDDNGGREIMASQETNESGHAMKVEHRGNEDAGDCDVILR